MTRNAAAVPALIEEGKQAERDGDLERALERYEAALATLDRSSPSGTAADLLRWIGTVRDMREEAELALEAYWASVAVSEAVGDPGRLAAALNCLAIVAQFSGDLEQAEIRYREARALAEAAIDDSLVAMIDQNLATLSNIRGDVQDALDSYESALRRLLLLDRQDAAAKVLNNMGMAHVDLEQWEEATGCFDRGYEVADRIRDSALLAVIDLNRAELHLRQGHLGLAREACDRGFETYSRIGSEAGRGESLKLYGCIARQARKPYLAASHFEAALELAGRSGDPLLEAEVETERAMLFLDEEQNQEALR